MYQFENNILDIPHKDLLLMLLITHLNWAQLQIRKDKPVQYHLNEQTNQYPKHCLIHLIHQPQKKHLH